MPRSMDASNNLDGDSGIPKVSRTARDWNRPRSHWIGHCPARNCPVLVPRRCAGGRRIAGTSAPVLMLGGEQVPLGIAIKGTHSMCTPGNCVTTRRGMLSCPWLLARSSCRCRSVHLHYVCPRDGEQGAGSLLNGAMLSAIGIRRCTGGVVSSMLATFPLSSCNFFFLSPVSRQRRRLSLTRLTKPPLDTRNNRHHG